MNKFGFKHVLFFLWSDKFASLFLDSLINKVGVDPKKICVVKYGRKLLDNNHLSDTQGVTYLELEDTPDEIFINAETITYFSLNSYNSKYIRLLFEIAPEIAKKTYMFITDDEVERWLKCQVRHGKIIPDKELYISEDDSWVLQHQTNFLGLKNIFKNKLDVILGCREWNFVDTTSVFDILPVVQSSNFRNALDVTTSTKKTFLLGTKPNAFKYKEIRSIIKSFVGFGRHEDFNFIIIWPVTQWRKRLLLELYFLYLHKVKNVTLNVSILTSLPPLAYNAVICSCTHLLLQPRGGGGTARLFLKYGLGKVYTLKGGHNERFFTEAQSVDLIEYSTFNDLAESLDKSVDIQSNALKVNAEELRSIKELAEFYS